MQADRRCRFCNGRGGWHDGRRWHSCRCQRGNRLTARIIRETRERITGEKQLTMAEMLEMGSSPRRAKDE